MLSLCQKIKALCKLKNVTISSLEQQAGLVQNTIFTWDRIIPSADKILKVAQCLGVSTDSILGNDFPATDQSVAQLKPATIEVVTVLEQTNFSEKCTDIVIDVIHSLNRHIGQDSIKETD